MKSILKPTEVLDDAIDAAKMRVKVAILKAAEVVEHETAFQSARAGWQLGFYLKSRKDTLKVIAVAAANDFETGMATKAYSGDIWETYVNLDKQYS